MKIASLNVRSLIKPSMHQQIVTYMRNTNIQILGLQETKSRTITQYVDDDYIFMTISISDAQQQEYASVNFVLNPKARNALLRISYQHSRLAWVLASGELTIVNTHAPRNGRSEEERQAHFDELQQIVGKTPAQRTFCRNRGPQLLPSWQTGRRGDEEDVLGRHIYEKGSRDIGEEDTANRFLLIDLCKANNLIVANTWFLHPPDRQVTYREPHTKILTDTNSDWSPQDFAQFDLYLIPQRWRISCTDMYRQPRANLDSDHFPLVVCTRVKLGAKSKSAKNARWDFANASQESIAAMNREIEERLDRTNLQGGGVSQVWEQLSNTYIKAIEYHVPKIVFKSKKP